MCDSLKDKLTVLVNSCDNYEDLWKPFFLLYKKYWTIDDIRLILNTETKDYRINGLRIDCIHSKESNISYGKRMQYVLSQINTPYVLVLLDDFFLRQPVNSEQIYRIVDWMDKDRNIVYFNCDNTEVFVDWESDLYQGFHRIPQGNSYILNLQAAIWRTDKLLCYWKPDISPWEWEEYTNLKAARNRKDKFYCVKSNEYRFCDYGFDIKGMGVHKGKWVKNDVVPLFEKEGIEVDYSKRGFLEYTKTNSSFEIFRESLKKLPTNSDLINRCLDNSDRLKYWFFVRKNKALGIFKFSSDILYIKYQLFIERKRFIKNHYELINQKR